MIVRGTRIEVTEPTINNDGSWKLAFFSYTQFLRFDHEVVPALMMPHTQRMVDDLRSWLNHLPEVDSFMRAPELHSTHTPHSGTSVTLQAFGHFKLSEDHSKTAILLRLIDNPIETIESLRDSYLDIDPLRSRSILRPGTADNDIR